MEPHSNDLPTRYVTLDPPRRGSATRTVSFWCPSCKTRHTHGAPGCSGQPGEGIGSRGSHCGAGDYLLTIGPEEHHAPIKIPRTRQKSDALAGTHAAVSAELAELFA